MHAFKRLLIVGPFPSCLDDVKVFSTTFPAFFLFYWCDQGSTGKGERWKQGSRPWTVVVMVLNSSSQNEVLMWLHGRDSQVTVLCPRTSPPPFSLPSSLVLPEMGVASDMLLGDRAAFSACFLNIKI